MLSRDVEETKYTKVYEFRIDKNGELDSSIFKQINDNIQKYGFKVTDISGGTMRFSVTLEKSERKDNLLKL
jgi:phosphoribosylformylglycinamidine (FGAM) synthase PurS component